VHSHNKVRALFVKNKVRFARAEQLCPWPSISLPAQQVTVKSRQKFTVKYSQKFVDNDIYFKLMKWTV